jgi:hypothetical protein
MPFASTFAFIQPWLLLALIGLPALWFLLRVTPPAPKRVRFPGLRLLRGLTPPEETPARTPLWLLVLRMAAAALVILGFAGPTLYPASQLSGSGPLVLVVDTGWASGKAWAARMQSARAMLDRARRDDRRVILLTTARPRAGEPITASAPMSPRQAGERLAAMEPQPWPRDLQAARDVVADLSVEGSAHSVWLADGLDAPGARALATQLQRLGRLDVRRPDPVATARIVKPPSAAGSMLTVPVRRADASGDVTETVLARAADGTVLGSAAATFTAGAKTAEAKLDLPLELRNRIARVELRGEQHAGAVALLDARWRRHPVGLADGGGGGDAAQPLLSELYYLERALQPYAQVRRGGVGKLLEQDLGVLVLSDRGGLRSELRQRVAGWVDNGGVVLRFAGPKLAENLTGEDVTGPEAPLLPVPLRRGGRALGGAMSWSSPATLAPFPADSPFAGIDVPEDVEVQRQVLAEPSLDLDKLTWARLTDGTPLVTAAPRGQGWVVLVHTTANTRWSNLPLSGVFVQMLRRISAMGAGESGGAGEGGSGELAPHYVLDGFADRVAPPDGVRALDPETREAGTVAPANPPGIYGPKGARQAHNLGPAIESLELLSDLPPGVVVDTVDTAPETRLGPWLLTLALLLLLADLLIGLWLRGLLPQMPGRAARRASASALVLAVAMTAAPDPSAAQDPATEFAKKASLETHLAYVQTGQPTLDQTSRQGLRGLSRVLTRRTAVEPGDPMGVNLRRDPLDVFPLIYWPITPQQPDLTSKAARKVNDFLQRGGTIVFDLREPTSSSSLFGSSSANTRALQRLTRDVDIPPLRRVGGEHVLTKTFYLLQDFPGRYAGGTLWVEDTSDAAGDGVASVIVGSSDWAGAWAVDNTGRPRFAVTPGGERQREMARRVGVNIVMYALTGNYKADQVHVPAILERLGQ